MLLDTDAYSGTFLSSINELQFINAHILQFYDINGGDTFPNRDYLIKDCDLPLFGLELEKTEYDLIVPTKQKNYGSFSFTFYCQADWENFNYCYDWLASIYDFDRRVFKKNFNKNKKNAIITFIRNYPVSAGTLGFSTTLTNNQIIQNAQFYLRGIQITGIEDIKLNEDGEPLEITINTEIQRTEYLPGKLQLI